MPPLIHLPADMTDGVLSLLLGTGLTLPSRFGGKRKLESPAVSMLGVPMLELELMSMRKYLLLLLLFMTHAFITFIITKLNLNHF